MAAAFRILEVIGALGAVLYLVLNLCLLASRWKDRRRYVPLLLLLIPSLASATTYTAEPCNGTADQTKINTAIGLASDGDTVEIPAGSCTLTGAVTWTDKAIILQGAGVDVTTLNRNETAISITVSTNAGLGFRVTGLTLAGSLPDGADGMLVFGLGLTAFPTTRFRIDHVKFNHPSDNSARQLYIHGPMWGLIDHATLICGGCLNTDFAANTDAEYNAVLPAGDTSGDVALDLGTDKAVYLEDSTFTQSSTTSTWGYNDCTYGCRLVWRYNEMAGNAHWQTHATRGDSDRGQRGGLKYEIYNNRWESIIYAGCGGQCQAVTPISMRSGTGVVFNNTIVGSWQNAGAVIMDNQRCPTGDNCQINETPMGLCNGVNGLDGNVEANGWPCYDQIGRASNTQASVPVYLWNNGPEEKCADPAAAGDACSGSTGTSHNCAAVLDDYIKTTAHSNGDKDYCIGTTSMPASCGTHTNTYTPYTYPHPLQNAAASTSYALFLGSWPLLLESCSVLGVLWHARRVILTGVLACATVGTSAWHTLPLVKQHAWHVVHASLTKAATLYLHVTNKERL